ncbi:MAG: hypothetical protein K8L91_23305 [Anaerolineae bacterium]|nr:hypothetical protein [Anaerolineae bacterium]
MAVATALYQPIERIHKMSGLEQFQEFDGTIRKVIINGVMHFSVLDVFKNYGSGSKSPKQEWQRAKQRLE